VCARVLVAAGSGVRGEQDNRSAKRSEQSWRGTRAVSHRIDEHIEILRRLLNRGLTETHNPRFSQWMDWTTRCPFRRYGGFLDSLSSVVVNLPDRGRSPMKESQTPSKLPRGQKSIITS